LRNYSRGTYEKTKSGISREYGFRQTIADRPLLAVPLAADPLPGARGYCPPQVWSTRWRGQCTQPVTTLGRQSVWRTRQAFTARLKLKSCH